MMGRSERLEFARATHKLCSSHTDIHIDTITVRKENVQDHIRSDSNKLYNYMIRLMLLSKMRHEKEVVIVPDPRSIKVESGNSLPDYLQTLLWFHLRCETKLRMQPIESHKCLGIQFTDMLAGSIQAAAEDGNSDYLNIISPCLRPRRLF